MPNRNDSGANTRRKGTTKPLLSIEKARERRTPIDWKPADIAERRHSPALRVLENFPLEEIVPFIDWSPFFHTWELRGRYPSILDDPKAKELFDDAQKLLQRIVKEKLFTARARLWLFPGQQRR